MFRFRLGLLAVAWLISTQCIAGKDSIIYSSNNAYIRYYCIGEAGREAIVVLSDVMTWACEVPRLDALVRSAGPSRDVWFLYSATTEGIAEDLSRRVRGLHVTMRPDVSHLGGSVRSFSGERSKATTTSFLMWLNASEYSHAWYMETDTFFTGSWNHVFDPFPVGSGADVVSHLIPDVDPNWYFWKGCEVNGTPCKSITPIMATWFVMRMSRRLGGRILDALIRGGARGHHEALTLSICTLNKFQYTDLREGGVRGQLNAGGYLHWRVNNHTNMTLSYYEIQPLTLYHPIKCAADTSLGYKALMWTRAEPSVDEKLRRSQELPRRGNSYSLHRMSGARAPSKMGTAGHTGNENRHSKARPYKSDVRLGGRTGTGAN